MRKKNATFIKSSQNDSRIYAQPLRKYCLYTSKKRFNSIYVSCVFNQTGFTSTALKLVEQIVAADDNIPSVLERGFIEANRYPLASYVPQAG